MKTSLELVMSRALIINVIFSQHEYNCYFYHLNSNYSFFFASNIKCHRLKSTIRLNIVHGDQIDKTNIVNSFWSKSADNTWGQGNITELEFKGY